MGLKELTAAALAAAVAVARDHGLPADDPRILSARGNLLVHLAPAPAVARVATLTAFSRRDPFAWLRREVEVAGFAARHGGPTVPPADVVMAGVDPGPHRSDGFAVSLWSYVPAGSGPSRERAGPEAAGCALGQLHLSLADYPGRLPWMAPAVDQISDGLAALEREQVLDRQRLTALRARHGELLVGLNRAGQNRPGGQDIVLHGDSHPGNLLRTGADDGRPGSTGWAWVDLEETCRGPREWDLAVLARSWDSPGDVRTALTAYAAVTGTAIPSPDRLAPLSPLRDLEAAVWSLGMAHQYPARYQEIAAELLTRVLAGSG